MDQVEDLAMDQVENLDDTKAVEVEVMDQVEDLTEAVEVLELDDPKAGEVEVILTKADKGFETWLRSRTREELEAVVVKLNLRSETVIDDYLQFMAVSETVEVCSKCEWKTGCVACSYNKALAYVIRNQKTPQFWIGKSGKAHVKAYGKKK